MLGKPGVAWYLGLWAGPPSPLCPCGEGPNKSSPGSRRVLLWGGGGGGLWGGPPPPSGDPELLEGAEGAEEIFWPKLTCAEGARENF